MRRMQMKVIALCLLFAFFVVPALAGPQSGSQDNQTAPIVKKNIFKKKKKPKENSASPEAQAAAPSGAGSASSNAPTASARANPAGSTIPSKVAVGDIAIGVEIANTKANGKVWVKHDTGIYHKAG